MHVSSLTVILDADFAKRNSPVSHVLLCPTPPNPASRTAPYPPSGGHDGSLVGVNDYMFIVGLFWSDEEPI